MNLIDRNRADVIVVGGGVAGTSAAYRLARSGRKVALYEQRGLASGASGRNNGTVSGGSGMIAESAAANAAYALTNANSQLIKEMPEELETDFSLRCGGALEIATSETEMNHIRETATVQMKIGMPVEMMTPEDVRKLIPAVNPEITGARFIQTSCHIWPFELVHGFARNARRYGAEIYEWSTVRSLHLVGDDCRGVVTADGVVEADQVVLATNAYTPLLLKTLPEGAIVPARGQIIVTQPLPPLIPFPFGSNYDKEYGRQAAAGPVLCGGYRRLDDDQGLGHYDERTNPRVLAGIASCLTNLFPVLREVNVVRCWAGIMGFTADGLPLIGASERHPGIYLVAGFNGGGFSWTTVTGQVIADLVNGNDPGFDLNPFRPDRFESSGTAWANPYTAGEEKDRVVT